MMLVNPSSGYGVGYSYRGILRITILFPTSDDNDINDDDENELCAGSHTNILKYSL